MNSPDPAGPDRPYPDPSRSDPPLTARSDPGDPRWRITPTKIVVAVILLIGIVTPLLVSTYAFDEPRLLGFPFFYWYQLLWVFLAAAICAVAYLLLKRERDAYHRDHPGSGSDGPR
ncbi:MAG TPA: DUF3311 domain-containing protein [Microlunatus sp.]|nr:DUF3311 domain-containing protein [Microlunatus sp.]